MTEKLTKQELAQLKILMDPVLWAEATLKDPKNSNKHLRLRDYQQRMIKSKSKRKVSRCGRRIGKCVDAESTIITDIGPINVENLYTMGVDEKPAILTFNEITQEIVPTKMYFVMDNGVKPVYRIETSSGRINYATGNHPYLTLDIDGTLGWIEIDNMKVGDRIAVPSTYEGLVRGKELGPTESRLLGYLVGDGGTSQKSISFTNFDDKVIADIRQIVDKYDCDLKEKKGMPGNYSIVTRIPKNNKVIASCKTHGLVGKLAINKEVPKAILSGNEEDISNFLSAYWDCDGWCSIQSRSYDKSHKWPAVQVGAASSSEKLARQIQHLLLRLGIVSRVKKKKVMYQGEYRFAWQVTIGDKENISKFSEKISLISDKREALQDIIDLLETKNTNGNHSTYTIPKEIWSYIKKKQADLGLSNMDVCGASDRKDYRRLRLNYSPSREKIALYGENLDNDEYLLKISNNKIIWDEILSIEYLGERQTYDLTVPETHTFIADDIISHNTISMVVHILWYAFTNENSRQVIATPYDSQVQLIFDMIRQFVDSTPELSDSIESSVKTPHQRIQLKNGSLISGFTAGTRSGAAGGSLRGQAADWLYMD